MEAPSSAVAAPDHAQTQTAPEVDGRSGDQVVVGVVGHVRDERLVDLDLIDGETLEIGETRVAGAVVIDCEPGPIVLGRAKQLAAALGAECIALSALEGGDLTVQILRRLEVLQ